MIKKFIEDFEKTIGSTPIVLSSNIQKHFGPDAKTAYLRGSIVFIDSSCLEIAVFVSGNNKTISFDKYRYQYMDDQKRMIFRYDNAPHHPEILTHPHHKHIQNTVITTNLPSIKEVLNEIIAALLKK